MSVKFHMANLFARIFYPKFKNREYINGSLAKFILWQKILRINGSVAWPVHFTSKVIEPSNIQTAEVFRPLGMATGNYIDARNGIVIEENVHVGPQVAIISRNHSLSDFDVYTNDSPIILHKNCWLATGCKILAGVELGEHTIVGAGAVVTHSFP